MGKTSDATRNFLDKYPLAQRNGIIDNYTQFMSEHDGWDADQWDAYFNNLMSMQQSELDYQRSLENQQRERDWALADREHAEQYNDPSQQLARLMATGMSRQAAMAALSAGESPQVAAASDAVSAGAPTSPSGTVVANANQTLETGLNAAESLVQLGMQAYEFGLSLPSMRSQNSINAASAYLANMQTSAYNLSGEFYSGIHQAVLNGSLSADSFTDYDTMARLAYSLPDSPENHSLYNFMHNGGYARILANPYAMENQHSLFNSNWGTRDTASNVVQSAEIRDMTLSGMAIDQQRTSASIVNLLANRDLLLQELEFNKVANPLRLKGLELDNTSAEFAIQGQIMENSILENDVEQSWRDNEIARECFENVKASAISRAVGELKRLSGLNNPEVIAKELRAYCASQDNAYAIATLGFMSANHSIEFYNKHPELQTYINVADDMHLTEILGNASSLLAGFVAGRGVRPQSATLTGNDATRAAQNVVHTKSRFKPRSAKLRTGAYFEEPGPDAYSPYAP